MARDTWVVAGSVITIVLLAGLYTVHGVGMNMSALDMTRMAGPIGDPMAMGGSRPWTFGYALLVFLMWWAMMIAMMTPSAAPTLLLYTALKRHGSERASATKLSLIFLVGYLVIWGGFSLLATGAHWGTEKLGLVDGPMMALASHPAAGLVLILAGLFQFSALKTACLKQCSSPADFLTRHRRTGSRGALLMGMHHGAYCFGCCWALMALLFVGGIMNLYWIVGLALYVLAEKIIPKPRFFSRLAGAFLIGWGLWCVFSSV
jgi:predicted metal-binding membrane protein